jgi:hypothetical protein
MKNPNDPIGKRIRDLPACSAHPQPTAYLIKRKLRASVFFELLPPINILRYGNRSVSTSSCKVPFMKIFNEKWYMSANSSETQGLGHLECDRRYVDGLGVSDVRKTPRFSVFYIAQNFNILTTPLRKPQMSHYVQIFSYAALTQRRTWCPPGSSLEVQ